MRLPRHLVPALERLRLSGRGRLSDPARGERLAGRGGASLDFVDHRDYSAGDELRHVDWHAFARLHRPFLKQFRREEERHLAILVDGSASMAAGGKHALAAALAGALAVVGLAGSDRVSLWATGAGAWRRVPPTRGRAGRERLLEAAAALPPPAGAAGIAELCAHLAGQLRGRGVALLLSDFLAPQGMRRALGLLAGLGLEPQLIQILAPEELAPDLSGDRRLVDSETGEGLDVSGLADLLELYQQARATHQAALAAEATARGGRHLLVASDAGLDGLLLDDLRRKGWLVA